MLTVSVGVNWSRPVVSMKPQAAVSPAPEATSSMARVSLAIQRLSSCICSRALARRRESLCWSSAFLVSVLFPKSSVIFCLSFAGLPSFSGLSGMAARDRAVRDMRNSVSNLFISLC